MGEWPLDKLTRNTIRERESHDILNLAKATAANFGLSIKCTENHHSDKDYGCRNSGVTCLCKCHDKE